MIYRPMYVEKIMAYVDTPFVKVLTGVRRCGKSTILKMIMEKLHNEKGIPKEQIVSYRFDSMEYEDMTAKQMYEELKSRLCKNGRTYLFLDEMQEIKNWERVVNSICRYLYNRFQFTDDVFRDFNIFDGKICFFSHLCTIISRISDF